jgi:hypothetical protein
VNKKYLPKDAFQVSAARWLYQDVKVVAEFLKMLIDNNLQFCFDSCHEESTVDIDIHGRDGKYLKTVDHGNWLVIGHDGKLEEMSDSYFNEKYREVK